MVILVLIYSLRQLLSLSKASLHRDVAIFITRSRIAREGRHLHGPIRGMDLEMVRIVAPHCSLKNFLVILLAFLVVE